MHDPQQLFEGWLSGDLTTEEVDMLLARMEEGKDDSPWPSMIKRLIDDPGIAGMGNDEQRERLFRQLMERGRLAETAAQPGRLARIRPLRWAVAAAFILLVAGSFWWFHAFRSENAVSTPGSPLVAKSDLLPGGNKAILTLGNGSTIVLDSSAQGKLAEQPGSIIVKSGSGQIVYQRTGGGDAHSLAGVDDALQSPYYNTLSTPRGGQYKLVLPDGSVVWLNAASSITYPTTFTGKERKVQISGEAYFEIAKNNAAPFRVKVRDLDVLVLGTHFDVNAYDDEASINTTLLEGAVKVASRDRQELLQPGQQAQLHKSGSLKVIPHIDEDAVMAWKNGFFSFHHTDLQTVMRELARWYDVEVEYRGNIPDMKFGGDISRSSNASQVLHILEESKIHFVIEGKKIIVTP